MRESERERVEEEETARLRETERDSERGRKNERGLVTVEGGLVTGEVGHGGGGAG